jgi:hypothetical protein
MTATPETTPDEQMRHFKDWFVNEYDGDHTAMRRARVIGEDDVAAEIEQRLNRDERLYIAVVDDDDLDARDDWVARAWAEFEAQPRHRAQQDAPPSSAR